MNEDHLITEWIKLHGSYENAKPPTRQSVLAYAAAIAAPANSAPSGDSRASEARLDKPAQVSNTRFGVGVKWSTVIGAAQRHHEYMNTSEKEKLRIEGAHAFLAELNVAPLPASQAASDVLFDIEPTLRKYSSSEPSLRKVLSLYYQRGGIGEVDRNELIEEYFATILSKANGETK